MKKVAIIGAGLTGLTTAFYLKKEGLDFVIFEKDTKTGGVISTKKTEDFLYETGPNSGTISNAETVELFDNLQTLLDVEIANSSAKKRLILKDNKWQALPSGILSGINTNLFSFADKLRLLAEPFREPGTNPNETIGEIVKRRMGQSFLDYAIDPFISGIYAGNPNRLVTKYALPKLYNLEQKYGSFIGGAIKKRKEIKPYIEQRVSKDIFSIKGGLSQLTITLEKYIGSDNIILNTEVLIEKEKDIYKVNNQYFSYIVSTVSANNLPRIFQDINKNKFKDITNLRYAKVVEITLGFNKWEGIDLNAFGGLIPSKEHKNILGILFMSTLFKDRAPKNGALITSFVGGIKKEYLTEMNRDELINLLKPELQSLLQLPNFNPDLIELSYHKRAIAQYDKTSENRILAINDIEKENTNLFLAGSIRDGVGMADRIKQASLIAKQIINNIKFH